TVPGEEVKRAATTAAADAEEAEATNPERPGGRLRNGRTAAVAGEHVGDIVDLERDAGCVEAQAGDHFITLGVEEDALVGAAGTLVAVGNREGAAADRAERDAAGTENVDRVVAVDRAPVDADAL